MRDEGAGCLGILAIMVIFWGIVAYLIIRPPDVEDIPWFVAGASVFIIMYAYNHHKK